MLEVHHESGGFAPWNFGSACLGGRNDRISVECLNLVHRGGVISLGNHERNAIKSRYLKLRAGFFFLLLNSRLLNNLNRPGLDLTLRHLNR
jgi:hypothetical protein